MSPTTPTKPDARPARKASRSVALRVLLSFLPQSLPPMARANYRREALAAVFLPFALAATEGAIISVLVRVAYEDRVDRILLNFAVGLLAAAPAMANITSFVWVKLSHGSPKIRFMNMLQFGLMALVLLIAISPRNEVGLALTTLAVIGGRMFWAGLVTIRSTVWRYNYRRDVRAQITGKFATIQVLSLALLGLGLGQAMDFDERAFRIMLPLGVLIAGIGVWHYSKIRVRHEASLLSGERKGDARRSVSLNPWSVVRTLRDDRPFARFMAAQFLLGMGNMMAGAPLVLVLREQFGLGYLAGILIASSIPMGLMPIFIPIWARLLDHTHIVRFRTIHSWAFLANLGLMIAGVWTGQVWLVVFAVVAKGIAFAGGVLAWNLGHLDFAPPGRESQYMGVHVTLTGVRGAVAPMLGVSIYTIAASSGFEYSPGAWTYGLCLFIAGCGTAAFFSLVRDPAVRDRIREEPYETAPPSRTND